MKGNGDDDKDQAEDVEATGLDAVPESEVEALRRENADLREQVLRKRAEFENYRRRIERERDQIGAERAAQVLKGLIQPIDNLERALAAATEDDPLKQGVDMIRRELMALLEASGVTIEDPVGQPFNPERHQALSTEAVPGYADGTVVEVFRKGYALKDRLLRPALVKVAQADEGDEGTPRDEKVH